MEVAVIYDVDIYNLALAHLFVSRAELLKL